MLLVRGVIFKMKLWASVVCYWRGQWPSSWPAAVSSIKDVQYYRRNLQMLWNSYYIIILIVDWGGESTSSVPPWPQEPQVRTEAYALTSAQPIVMVAVRLPGMCKWYLFVTVSALSRAKPNWLLLFREMTTGLFWELYGTQKAERLWVAVAMWHLYAEGAQFGSRWRHRLSW
jgi:hypothetical protein